jgi:hypothetical protein
MSWIDGLPASALAMRGRRRWLRFWPVVAAAVVLVVGALTVGGLTTSTVIGAPSPTPQPTPPPTSTTSMSATATAAAPTPSGSRSDPIPGSALAQTATLPVKGRAPKTGYSRDQFGYGWRTSGGCDTRERVLRRDISQVKVLAGTGGCTVVGGQFHDPYRGDSTAVTARTISTTDIDHVVSLSDAWQKGAQQWDRSRRVAFANDQVELLATSQSLNSAKGDGDTATWLPPNKSFRCAYVARQVTIKAKYQLWVTHAESDAMTRVLATCPQQRTITAAEARKPKDPDATVTAPKPKIGAKAKNQSTGGGGQGTDRRFWQ